MKEIKIEDSLRPLLIHHIALTNHSRRQLTFSEQDLTVIFQSIGALA
jgi:hypothetical protein